MPKANPNQFNIIIAGFGGQGVITLAKIISQAAFKQGFQVKTSETHGLAQRGGSLEAHVRFGKKIISPLVMKGEADLIIALDFLEGEKARDYANPKTKIIIKNQPSVNQNFNIRVLKDVANRQLLPIRKEILAKEVKELLNVDMFST